MTSWREAAHDGGSDEPGNDDWNDEEFDFHRDVVIDEIAAMLETGDWDSEMAAYGKAFAEIVRRMRTYAKDED